MEPHDGSRMPRVRSAILSGVDGERGENWVVYVLVSEATGETYVGVTNALERRVAQHNGEQAGGARSTRRARPWVVAATYGPYETRGESQRVEHAVKRLRGRERLEWVEGEEPLPGRTG